MFLLAVCLAAQPSAVSALPVFDVASLKQAPPPVDGPLAINLGNAVHGTVTLTNATLSECLRYAFDIHDDAQISGPEWIKQKSTLFDIVAKAPPGTPTDQLRLMARALLIERFKLALHSEQRELRSRGKGAH
jgi:uncharacterized protein (TIGR03435 family)